MPRPTRKPKRFNPSNTESNLDAPVISTPLHSKQSTTNPPLASPELSPIQRENEFTIYADENQSTIPEQDHFGFGRVKGVKKTFVPIQIDSDDGDDDDNLEDDVSVKDEDDDEDIYGEPYVPPTTTEAEQLPRNDDSSPARPTPKKRSISKLRTSQLLPLLPTRRKRQPTRPQKKLASLDTSDSKPDVPGKSKSVKKRGVVVDQENDGPEEEIDSDEERQIEARRKIVKKKFAEVDNWEMAFETVDLSFSSQ